MIAQTIIPLPDNIFWYSVSIGFLFVLVWITKWWISKVESRQDVTDQKFNVFIQEMASMRNTQSLQNQVLEQHSKYIERSETNIGKMTETMIETLRFLTNTRDEDDDNPTVRRMRGKRDMK